MTRPTFEVRFDNAAGAVRPFFALSLGGGQVSSALAIAIADKLTVNGYDFGELAPLGACTFADTGHELQSTYRHIDTLRAYLAGRGVRLDVVRKGGLTLGSSILARVSEATGSASAIPLFLAPSGRAEQHCTRDFKGAPIDANTRRLAKRAGALDRVQVLIGYGIDEIERVRNDVPESWPPGWRWRYPLIEAGVGRAWAQDVCRAALGYVPVTSACAFCPHRPDIGPASREWIKANEPVTWKYVVEFDKAIRNGYGGLLQTAFLSGTRQPVEDAITASAAQGELFPSCGREQGRCFS